MAERELLCVCAAGGDEDVDFDGGYEEMGCSFNDAVIDLWPEARVAAGTRVFVLTPLGETLQIWKVPGSWPHVIDRIAVFGIMVGRCARGSMSGVHMSGV